MESAKGAIITVGECLIAGSLYITNTRFREKNKRKVFTQADTDELSKHISEVNKRSGVVYIHKIEHDAENHCCHIYFEYFGNKKPNGTALQFLNRLAGMPILCHDYKAREEYEKQRILETKDRYKTDDYRRSHREYCQREDVKKHKKDYYARGAVRKHRKEYRRAYCQTPAYKAKNRVRRRYEYYLQKHNLTKAEYSLERWRAEVDEKK